MQDLIIFFTNHPLLSLSALIIAFLVMIVELVRAKGNKFSLLPVEATQMINHDNAIIIDIRSPESFRKGHIISSHNMPMKELVAGSKKLEKFKNKPLILVCNLGMESQKITSIARKQGYNAYSISGGMRGWIEAQMPVIKE